MRSISVQYTLLIMFSVGLVLGSLGTYLMMRSQLKLSLILQKEKTDLWNRLMSQDLKTYSAMSALTTSTPNQFEDNYTSMHDQAELERLNKFASHQGLGEAIDYSDEETIDFLNDLGFTSPGDTR